MLMVLGVVAFVGIVWIIFPFLVLGKFDHLIRHARDASERLDVISHQITTATRSDVPPADTEQHQESGNQSGNEWTGQQ